MMQEIVLGIWVLDGVMNFSLGAELTLNLVHLPQKCELKKLKRMTLEYTDAELILNLLPQGTP